MNEKTLGLTQPDEHGRREAHFQFGVDHTVKPELLFTDAMQAQSDEFGRKVFQVEGTRYAIYDREGYDENGNPIEPGLDIAASSATLFLYPVE